MVSIRYFNLVDRAKLDPMIPDGAMLFFPAEQVGDINRWHHLVKVDQVGSSIRITSSESAPKLDGVNSPTGGALLSSSHEDVSHIGPSLPEGEMVYRLVKEMTQMVIWDKPVIYGGVDTGYTLRAPVWNPNDDAAQYWTIILGEIMEIGDHVAIPYDGTGNLSHTLIRVA